MARLNIKFGANHTIMVDRENTVEAVMDFTNGHGVDVTVDVTASTRPIIDAVEVTRPGGTVVLAGVKGAGNVIEGLVTDKNVQKELTVKGMSAQDLRAFEPALRLIESRKYPLELMHTHSFGLDEVPRAIEMLAGLIPGEEATHVMIVP